MRSSVVFTAIITLALALGASAQEVRSEVSVQGTGFFTKNSTSNNGVQRATETGGVLAGYRYHLNRWLAVETVYGYDRNSQSFATTAGSARVQANVHQATGGFVVSLPAKAGWRISPYLLAEGGALVFDPTGNNTLANAKSQSVGTFVYGGGADFPIVRHLSLRAEYRGLVYNTPDFWIRSLNVDRTTHTAQPSAGLVYRF
jgi:outer membrane immunogenic protein